MDDLELMKKYYFEKEKENLRLKEELNQYKTKLTKNESSSLTQRQDYNTQPVTMENLEDDNDFIINTHQFLPLILNVVFI